MAGTVIRIILLTLLACCAGREAYAQLVWTGDGEDDNWSTPTNWADGKAPAPGASTWLRFGGEIPTTAIADTLTPWVLNRIEFGSPAQHSYNTSDLSGNSLSFQGAACSIEARAWAEQTIANDVMIGSDQLMLFSYVRPLVINGRISGGGRLRKTGDGLVVISNPANSYTNFTTIEFGPLQFTHPSAIGGSGASVVIGGGGALGASFAVDQALLARVHPQSTGVVALGGPSSQPLDFAAAGLPDVSLGAIGSQTFAGTVEGYGGVVRLTGVYGALELTQKDAIRNATDLHLGILYSGASSVSGNIVLSGDNAVQGDAAVNSGTAELRQSTLRFTDLTVRTTLLLTNATASGGTITVQPGATLKGCGSLDAEVLNFGTIVADCGDLRFTGGVTNDGTVRLSGSSTITADGRFINNGVLDLLTSPDASLPSGLVNNGTIVYFGQVRVRNVAKSGNTFKMRFESLSGHSYQLQRSSFASGAEWQDVGSPRTGSTGADIEVQDDVTGASTAFYRVVVDGSGS